MSQWHEPSASENAQPREDYRLWRIVALILVAVGLIYLFMRWNPFSFGSTETTKETGGASVPFASRALAQVKANYDEKPEPGAMNGTAAKTPEPSSTSEQVNEKLLTALKGLQAGQVAQTMAISKLYERLEQQKTTPATTTPTPKETDAQKRQRQREAEREAEERERKLKEWKPKVWERVESKDKRSEVEAVDGEPDPLRLNAGWEIPIAIEGQITSMAKGGTRFWVTRDVMDSATGQNILLAQDSYGILESQGSILMGDERMTVVTATEMSWPNGTPIKLGATSVSDVTGMPGFADLLDRRLLPNLLAALMTGVLRMGTAMPIAADGGITEKAGASVGMEVANRGSEQIRQTINTSPRMKIRQAYQGLVLTRKPMVFSKAFVR
jgi:type IV secretory pathway VirB10-like protein